MNETVLILVDRGSQEIESMFGTSLFAMRGALSAAVVSSNPLSQTAFNEFRAKLHNIVTLSGRAIRDEFAKQANYLANLAAYDAGNTSFEALDNAISVLQIEETFADIARAQQNAANYYEDAFRQFQWTARMSVISGKRSHESALTHARVKMNISATPIVPDRAWRGYSASLVVRNLARMGLLDAYNDTFVISLGSMGVERAQFVGKNKSGEFAIFGDENTENSYLAIRRKFTHPNSDALVRRIDDVRP